MNNRESFFNLNNWLKEVEKFSPENTVKLVLANKCDLDDREVSDHEIQMFEKETGCRVMMTSAKSGVNVDESFLDITKQLIKNSAQDQKSSGGLAKLGKAFKTTPGGPDSSPKKLAVGENRSKEGCC